MSRPAFSTTTRFLECKQTHRDRPRVAGQLPTVRGWSWASCGCAVRRTASRSAPTLLGIAKWWPTWRFCESLNDKAKTPTRGIGFTPHVFKARAYYKVLGRGLCGDPELLPPLPVGHARTFDDPSIIRPFSRLQSNTMGVNNSVTTLKFVAVLDSFIFSTSLRRLFLIA